MCGIANYTRQLQKEFSNHFASVDVIEVNQFLIRNKSEKIVQNHILSKINNYQYLNIQWEPGIFGSSQKKSYKMLFNIINSFKGERILLTCHSLKPNPSFFQLINISFLKKILFKKKSFLNGDYYQNLLIKKVSKKQKLSLLLHSFNDAQVLRYFTNLNVDNFPLMLPTQNDIDICKAIDARNVICKQYNLDPSKTYIGVYGFLSAYKGLDVAINSLPLLPDNYHLIISSNQHPNIAFKKADLRFDNNTFNPNADKYLNYIKKEIQSKKLFNRVHFINHIEEEIEFMKLIAGIDISLFPYYEVGSGGSGPLSYASMLSQSGKIILSKTMLFNDYCNHYFKDCFTFFDQGNEVELAYKILHAQPKLEQLNAARQIYNPLTNALKYYKLFS
jgi:glycosyltransferase involved in cell wall biosynthesis